MPVYHSLDSRLDVTDVYLFRGEQGTVFVISVNSSAAGSDTPAAFHPDAQYDFRIDLNGGRDATEELVFRVTFGDLDRTGRQPFELRRLVGDDTRVRAAAGSLIAWGVTETIVSGSDGTRVWAGLGAESAYVEPTVLDAVRRAMRFGRRVELGAWQHRRAVNAYAGTTVYAIVLELRDDVFEGVPDQRQIGFWATTTVATDSGGWRPCKRRGLPMLESLFLPPDDELSSDYNSTHPSDDYSNYGQLVSGLVARLVAAHGTADDAAAYGDTVARLLLPDVLRYRVGTSACFSFASRNGRGLSDNAPDVMLSLVTNRALSSGLNKRHAAGSRRPTFPYVPPPPSSLDPSA